MTIQRNNIPTEINPLLEYLSSIEDEFNEENSIGNIECSNECNIPMDALFISGGATRFAGLVSAAIECYKHGYLPKIIAGTSSGALMSLPLALGKFDTILQASINVERDDFFDISPTTNKGKISWCGVFRALFGYYSFGVQNIPDLLRKYVSKEEFESYQKDDSMPDIFIMAVNANTANPKFWNLKDDTIDYEKYLLIVAASCAIPIMTQAIWIDDQPYFDGGMRNHIPSAAILSKYNIGRSISIYARPQKFVEFDDKWGDGIIKMIWRTIRIMSIAISKADERNEKAICLLKNIKNCQIFIPNILDSLYDTNDLNILAEESANVAKIVLKDFIS